MALCDWLGPYHDHARPPAATVLAEATKQADAKAGKAAKAPLAVGSGDASANGHAKKSEEPPPVKDAPEVVTRYFDGQ